MTVNKRCGTCIDRKISCDRALPACSNCVRSSRTCKGYGIRLSWPRDSDRKRSMLGPVPPRVQRSRWAGPTSTLPTIHVTTWDVELYRASAASRAGGRSARFPLYRTLPSIPCRLASGEKALFSFFEAAISSSITTFGHYPVGSLIVRIALSGTSLSCVAVQRAVLAISCLVRHGSGPQADQLKLSAIRALIASANAGISPGDVAQHINEQSETSNQWTWYICGAKDIMGSVDTMGFFTVESGLSSLLDWTFYHEVLSQFSRRHWRPIRPEDRASVNSWICDIPGRACVDKRLVLNPGAEGPLELTPGPDERLVPHERLAFNPGPDERLANDKRMVPCNSILKRNKALSLLARVCEVVLPAWDPASRTRAHMETIAALEQQVEAARTFEACMSARSSGITGARVLAATVDELFRISILIYLCHASDPNARQTHKLNRLVDQGFSLLAGTYGTERPFPILIIGFEARNDEERLAVLDFITDAVRRKPCGRYSFGRARVMLQAVWNQDDLLVEDEVAFDYMERLTAVISTYEVLPPLV